MKYNKCILTVGTCLVLVVVVLFSSCTADRVASSSFIQKRKYTKGYHRSFAKAERKAPSAAAAKEVQAKPEQSIGISINPIEPVIARPSSAGVEVIAPQTEKEMPASNVVAASAYHIAPPAVKKLRYLPVAVKTSDSKRTSGLAVLSFAFSVLGFITPITIFGFLLGVILGFMALNSIKKNPDTKKGKGWAKTGIVIGFIGLLIVFLIIAVFAMEGFGTGWFAMP